MVLRHNDCFNYELPNNWCAEETEDNLLLYHPDGDGAMVMSFFNLFNVAESLDEQVCTLAKRFIDQNSIKLHGPLTLLNTKEGKTVLYGTGTTSDNWFVKLWVVAKTPKIVFATYQGEQKNKEVKMCALIIDSIQFTF